MPLFLPVSAMEARFCNHGLIFFINSFFGVNINGNKWYPFCLQNLWPGANRENRVRAAILKWQKAQGERLAIFCQGVAMSSAAQDQPGG